jgi:hypothetical protein
MEPNRHLSFRERARVRAFVVPECGIGRVPLPLPLSAEKRQASPAELL